MEFTPIGFVCLAAAAIVNVSPARLGLFILGAFLPMQAAAAFNLPSVGDASVLCTHIIAASLVFSIAIRPRNLVGALQYGARSPAVILLALFTMYAVASAMLLPRLFEGAVSVYSLERTDGPFALTPLYPTTGNFTQSVYLTANFLLFAVAAYIIAGRAGMKRATHAISAATAVHLFFAIVSVFPAFPPTEAILEFIRTANYDIHAHHIIAGAPRIIGSYPEPAAFGAASVGLFAWNFARFMQTRGIWHLGASLLLILCIGASLSTTAFASLFLVVALWGLHSVYSIVRPGLTSDHVTAMIFVGLAAIGLVVLFFVEPVRLFAIESFENLFSTKLASDSGVERGAWNTQSFRNFIDTNGLGVGLGGARASSLALALLGNVGAIGTLLYIAFLGKSYVRAWPRSRGRKGDRAQQYARRLFTAGRIATLGLLISQLIAGTMIDGGLIYFTFAAIATAAYTAAPVRKRSLQIDPIGDTRELAFPGSGMMFDPIKVITSRRK